MTKHEQAARAAALEWVNKQRAERGWAPLRRLDALWWRIHGADWLKKTKAPA